MRVGWGGGGGEGVGRGVGGGGDSAEYSGHQEVNLPSPVTAHSARQVSFSCLLQVPPEAIKPRTVRSPTWARRDLRGGKQPGLVPRRMRPRGPDCLGMSRSAGLRPVLTCDWSVRRSILTLRQCISNSSLSPSSSAGLDSAGAEAAPWNPAVGRLPESLQSV